MICFIRLQIIEVDFLRFEVDDWGRRYGVDHPLHVYDGPTSASPVLGKFRGRTLPGTIFSSSNTLFVSFDSHYSNHYVNRKGFEIKYTALEFNYGKFK